MRGCPLKPRPCFGVAKAIMASTSMLSDTTHGVSHDADDVEARAIDDEARAAVLTTDFPAIAKAQALFRRRLANDRLRSIEISRDRATAAQRPHPQPARQAGSSPRHREAEVKRARSPPQRRSADGGSSPLPRRQRRRRRQRSPRKDSNGGGGVAHPTHTTPVLPDHAAVGAFTTASAAFGRELRAYRSFLFEVEAKAMAAHKCMAPVLNPPAHVRRLAMRGSALVVGGGRRPVHAAPAPRPPVPRPNPPRAAVPTPGSTTTTRPQSVPQQVSTAHTMASRGTPVRDDGVAAVGSRRPELSPADPTTHASVALTAAAAAVANPPADAHAAASRATTAERSTGGRVQSEESLQPSRTAVRVTLPVVSADAAGPVRDADDDTATASPAGADSAAGSAGTQSPAPVTAPRDSADSGDDVGEVRAETDDQHTADPPPPRPPRDSASPVPHRPVDREGVGSDGDGDGVASARDIDAAGTRDADDHDSGAADEQDSDDSSVDYNVWVKPVPRLRQRVRARAVAAAERRKMEHQTFLRDRIIGDSGGGDVAAPGGDRSAAHRPGVLAQSFDDDSDSEASPVRRRPTGAGRRYNVPAFWSDDSDSSSDGD